MIDWTATLALLSGALFIAVVVLAVKLARKTPPAPTGDSGDGRPNTFRPWYKNVLTVASSGVVVFLSVFVIEAWTQAEIPEVLWGIGGAVINQLFNLAYRFLELEEKRLDAMSRSDILPFVAAVAVAVVAAWMAKHGYLVI